MEHCVRSGVKTVAQFNRRVHRALDRASDFGCHGLDARLVAAIKRDGSPGGR